LLNPKQQTLGLAALANFDADFAAGFARIG
jgi:hypothetical protein